MKVTATIPGSVAHVPLVTHASGVKGGGVELAALLDRTDELFARYVAFPSDGARWAVVLWAAHTHTLDAFESTPRLAMLSPEKGSGKTRVLEVLELIVPAPMHTSSMSASVLFRQIEAVQPTLLMDECDTYLGVRVAKEHEELRGLINAGHRRGAVAYRCDVSGKTIEPRAFPAFAAVALAGLGDLPDTIMDRSVVIPMKRRAPNESVVPFRHRHASVEAEGLHDAFAQWGEEHADDLLDYEPEMPHGIVDRAADVWEPLIMLGDTAGAVWSERARSAALTLNAQRQERDPSLGIQLLTDTRMVFRDDRMTTDALLEALIAMDEAPWADLRGNPLDARGLARRLRPYGIRPANHRFGERTSKGYLRADLYDAWARYLPPLSSPGEGEQGEQGEQVDTTDLEALYPELFEAES